MPYWTYILQGATIGQDYCGSSDNVDRRVAQHNDPNHHGSKTTKRFEGPWELVWMSDSDTRAEAVALEKRIKKRGIGRYLEDENHNRAVKHHRSWSSAVTPRA